jgi:hypothetical protein
MTKGHEARADPRGEAEMIKSTVAKALGGFGLAAVVALGATACGSPHSSVTVDGQPLAIAIQNWNDSTPPFSGTYGAVRNAFLTLSITNQGNTAVSLPLANAGNLNPTPPDLYVNISDSNDTSPPFSSSENGISDTQEVMAGQTITAQYAVTMTGPAATATQVQVSVDSSAGSGSVTLPINDSVPA